MLIIVEKLKIHYIHLIDNFLYTKIPTFTVFGNVHQKIVTNLRNLSPVLTLLMAWPFSPTSQQNGLCFTRLDRGRKEIEVLFTEQSSMTLTYGNVCLRICLSFGLSACLKPWLPIHQRFSPPACASANLHASLGSEFPFSPPFPSIDFLFHPRSMPSQLESKVWTRVWLQLKRTFRNLFPPI